MLKQKEFLKQHASKIWVELPGFISEKRLYWVKNQCSELSDNGFNRFVVSHLSQIELLPKNSRFATNEWIYAYNDAAIQFINSQGAQWMINPVENEYENMLTGAFRGQVIPVYYYPRLFYSRMPVKINQKTFTDERKTRYNKKVINGMTIIIPEKPVSITQYINKLSNKGFNVLWLI
jgi:putative protease